MTDMRTDKQSESTKMIRVDISKSLEFIGLPLITFEKDGESLTFLLDTGASMNLIKKTVLDHFSHDAEQLPQKTQYYGIDNVCHDTHIIHLPSDLAISSIVSLSRKFRMLMH